MTVKEIRRDKPDHLGTYVKYSQRLRASIFWKELNCEIVELCYSIINSVRKPKKNYSSPN